jgi:hypothetical protein
MFIAAGIIEQISGGWLWRDAATKQRHWFPHDRPKASHDNGCHVCVAEDNTVRHLSLHAASGLTIRLREGLGQIGSEGLKGRGLLRVLATACTLAAPGKAQPVDYDS